MKLYADLPRVRGRQIVTDLLVVVWLWFWIWAAVKVYDLVEKLAVPGRKLEGAGDGMAGGLSDAGDKVRSVPGVGGALASPLDKAAGAANSVADAGREQQVLVHDLAVLLVALVLAVPVALVLFGWLPLRVRWIRRASSAATLRDGLAGRDLLALRALAGQPLRRLVAVHAEPSVAWRSGDRATVDALAALELRSLGLRVPRR
ncbi:MAG TPA: hypothetical protein VF054_20610 [Micromonosporaceae bacterium]